MDSSYKKQLQYLDHAAVEKCLGVIIDGACARVRISENRQFGDIIAEAFEGHNIEIFDGFEAVRGAAYTAAALKDELPCYRETIVPIEIHYHRRNEKGDLENAWKMLIEKTTVRAGYKYKSPTPVEGLQIKQGAKTLKLTLRRPSDKGKYIYRKVSAEIPEETRRDEPVKISANLRPGQGFAKVALESAREGIFHTSLNWRTMEPCDPPPPPPLAYLPKVSRVLHDEEKWLKAEGTLLAATWSLKNDAQNLMDKLVQLREHINKWPLADRVDEYRGRIPKGDIFLHYGVFPSDGNLDEVQSPSVAYEFARECETYFSRRGISTGKKKSVQRTASWLYLACPSVIIESVRKNLRQGFAGISKSEIQLDLHTIGLCFDGPNDIKVFFAALEKRFQKKHGGINEWLRTGRNIVRFRENSLSPEIVGRSHLENVFSGILRSLKHEIDISHFARIFDNCVLLSLYLLKRRRYELDFLSSDSEHYRSLDEIFSTLINRRRNKLYDRQYKIVSITLKFLHQEASYDDLQEIMEEC
ncbi:MAG: hypothetical protein JRJ85_26350 [Deltaproteobacteria bacterium]|nr:hypothetical protein [Deltaproteobacteria bacterium]